jgi:hypothetical protein
MGIGILGSGLMGGGKLGTILDDVLKQAGDLPGKVIVTCTLPMSKDDTRLVIAHTSSGAEAWARKTRKADVVSAFSSVPSEVLFDVFAAVVADLKAQIEAYPDLSTSLAFDRKPAVQSSEMAERASKPV